MGNCINYAYSHDDDLCQNKAKWMSKLNDYKKLSALSIPGTHDTMSLGWGGDIAQTQSKSLHNQLYSGIRFLDIRLAAFPNSKDLLYSYHNFVYLHSTFYKILDTVTNFLKSNPSEVILMRIKQEYTAELPKTFASLLEKILNNTKYSNYLYKNYFDPYLKDARGKFIILQNFGGDPKWLLYSNFYIQDYYNLNTNWDLYSKWEKIKAHFSDAELNFRINSENAFINYLSGSGGSFPYFVASGHSSSETNAPLLLTGLIEPVFKNYYPDFPRSNWFGVFATILFQGTNKLTKAYIDKNKPSYVGIVVADFPGQGLINSIIKVNKF